VSLERPRCRMTTAATDDLVHAAAAAAHAGQIADEADAALGQRRRRIGPVHVGPDD